MTPQRKIIQNKKYGSFIVDEESIYEIQTPKYGHTQTCTHTKPEKPKAIWPFIFFKVGGIIKMLLFDDVNVSVKG